MAGHLGSRVLACLAGTMVGCASLVPTTAPFYQPANITDYQHLMMIRGDQAQVNESRQSLTDLYRSLGAVTYSQCKNLPSDSEFVKITAAQPCQSSAFALVGGVARLLWEHDRAQMSHRPPILYQGRLRWIDVPGDCP